jgi:hypothetical protein
MPQPFRVRNNRDPRANRQDPTSALFSRAEKVDMSADEIALYCKAGRPTGLLLSSVAKLKGTSIESIAAATGLSQSLVKAVFTNQFAIALSDATICKISEVVGIDSAEMRFRDDRVHFFDLRNLGFFKSREKMHLAMRGVGLLARGAKSARIRVDHRSMNLWMGKELFCAQSKQFRSIFTASSVAAFNPEWFVDGRWARGDRASSTATVSNNELKSFLASSDLTTKEFDEIFIPSEVESWADLREVARANGLSKDEVMSHIKTFANRQSDMRDTRNSANLRLVEVDNRRVANCR